MMKISFGIPGDQKQLYEYSIVGIVYGEIEVGVEAITFSFFRFSNGNKFIMGERTVRLRPYELFFVMDILFLMII